MHVDGVERTTVDGKDMAIRLAETLAIYGHSNALWADVKTSKDPKVLADFVRSITKNCSLQGPRQALNVLLQNLDLRRCLS